MKMNDSYDIISQIDETESAADDFNVDIFTSQTDMERELIMNHIKGDSILESAGILDGKISGRYPDNRKALERHEKMLELHEQLRMVEEEHLRGAKDSTVEEVIAQMSQAVGQAGPQNVSSGRLPYDESYKG